MALIASPFSSTGRYQGIVFIEDNVSTMGKHNVRVIGARLELRSFTNTPRERADLFRVLGDLSCVADYASGKSKTVDEVAALVQKDAERVLKGDFFSGYGICLGSTCIGRISIGAGYKAGESQSGIIIGKEYRGQGYGKEAVILMAALARYCVQKNLPVLGAPVESFTATVLDKNSRGIAGVTRLGMQYLRPVTPKENYSDEPRGLYGIEASQVETALGELVNTSHIYNIQH